MTTHDSLVSILLSQPPGTYALSSFGQTKAVILTGSAVFRTRAYTLFISMGGQARRGVFGETPLPPIHRADRPETVWFCLPEARVKLALALWFNAHLVRANLRDVFDAEGDFVEAVCDREAELWTEAEQLACDFIVSHMRPDYRALPTYARDDYQPAEHGLGAPGAAHVGDDGA